MAGSLLDGEQQLRSAIDLVDQVWVRTADDWQDVIRQRFGEEQIAPLKDHSAAAFRAIHKLAEVLNAARRACRDHDRDDG
jgi:hypothetical protein